jgi:hypothetical protein
LHCVFRWSESFPAAWRVPCSAEIYWCPR